MSAIASFFTLEREHLPQLLEDPYQTLIDHGRRPDEEYGWSGYCVAHVLTYLSDRDVDLFGTPLRAEADRLNGETFTLLLTANHKRFLPRLDPDGYDDESLAEHFEDMDYGFEEAPMAARDAIALLRDQIAALDAGEILIVTVS